MKVPLRTAIVISDLHIPFHDKQALSITKQILQHVTPDIFVINGDFLDCESISRFDKDPTRLNYLQDELNIGRTILSELLTSTPKAKRYFGLGNHEYRLQKLINKLDGPAREVARLDTFQEAVQWPTLLRLNPQHWTFVPCNKQPLLNVIPNMCITHGDVVRAASGYSAKGELDKRGISGISGHTHRLGVHYHTNLTGNRMWIENGCLCSLTPEYVNHPNWQQGFTVLSWVSTTVLPTVEQVVISNGTTLFRGVTYKG